MADQFQFALAPLLFGAEVLDYSTSEGAKLFKTATAPLKEDITCQPENLVLMISQLKTRARIMGWSDILNIPPILAEPDNTVDLLNGYGQLSLSQVRAHAETYVNNQNRAAQDSMQLYMCLMNSMSQEADNMVSLYSSQYTIGDQVSGTCLLKVVIRESHIDTNATTRTLRDKLSSLDVHIRGFNYNITKFNQYVRLLIKMLAARGQTTLDLLNNLFKAYQVVEDGEFKSYITMKKNEYDEGTELQPEELMQLAANKYKVLVDEGMWNAPTPEQEKIIALEASIKKLSKAQSVKSAPKKEIPTEPKDPNQKKGRSPKPAWMLIPPKAGEPTKKKVNEKWYHWCKNHKAWTRHTPAACEGKGITPRKDEENKTLKLSNALAAIVQDSDNEE